MPFDKPIPFREAVDALAKRNVMPSNLSSEDLKSINAAIRERSFFSARNTMERILESLKEETARAIEPSRDFQGSSATPEGGSTTGFDAAAARLRIKEALNKVGYTPDAKIEGTIQDLSSDARINLVLQTNQEMAQGYGEWQKRQSPESLDEYPAQRLFRLEEREEPRDWVARGEEAALATGSDIVVDGEGFVALINSPIWEEISEFDTPYPPYDYNSGMWTEPVSREEAIALGLIDEDTVIEPQKRGFEMEEA